jgi:cell division protein FtsB
VNPGRDWLGSLRRHPFWWLLAFVVTGWLLSSQGVRDYFVRRREHDRLEARLAETRTRLAEKRLRLSRAQKDADFQETEARRQLGLVRPEETEYRFIGKSSAPAAGRPVKP